VVWTTPFSNLAQFFSNVLTTQQIFEEDVVCVKDHGNQLGVVARLAWALGDRSGDLSASGSDNDSDDDVCGFFVCWMCSFSPLRTHLS
jgi:hypothetical protein